MPQICFRFYGELEEFFPHARRGSEHRVVFNGPQTVKHLVESVGVPHIEIGRMENEGHPVGWDYRPRGGECIRVYPRLPRQRWPADLDAPRFALDGHLGRLASYLRLLGFDTWYRPQVEDADLAAVAVSEKRVVLTRDQDLLKRKILDYGYWVRNTDPHRQVEEILARFGIAELARPFTRCPRCNGLLEPVPKELVLEQLEPLTRKHYDEFYRCAACGQVYWRGSHFAALESLLKGWLKESAD